MSENSLSSAAATAYATGGARGRTADVDVWLRGNVRPVVGIGAVAIGVLGAAAVAAGAAGAGATVVAILTAATVVVAAATVLMAGSAGGMRLGRRGAMLLLRLAPWRLEEVPLGIVECVFPGSQPLADGASGHPSSLDAEPAPATRRVGTLVIRFAERASEWRERPTFAPWGTWRDGHAIVDGRWCEPLTSDLARAIGNRLLDAKREAAAESGR
jgi:hypothetical protein